jgi:hypothetical protein
LNKIKYKFLFHHLEIEKILEILFGIQLFCTFTL